VSADDHFPITWDIPLLIDQNQITQQIVVDGLIVAAFVYSLERTVVPGSGPTVELLGFQRRKVSPPPPPTTRGRTISHPFSSPLTPEGAATQPPVGFYPNPPVSYHGNSIVQQQHQQQQHHHQHQHLHHQRQSPMSAAQMALPDMIDPNLIHANAGGYIVSSGAVPLSMQSPPGMNALGSLYHHP
jgi:hypothetical protein